MKQVAHPVAFVLEIIDARCSGAWWTGLPGLLHLLFAGLIQTHQNLILLVFTVIDFQHVLHGADKLRAPLRREAPALFQPGLEFVFFSV